MPGLTGYFVPREQARVAVLSGAYSDNYGPAIAGQAGSRRTSTAVIAPLRRTSVGFLSDLQSAYDAPASPVHGFFAESGHGSKIAIDSNTVHCYSTLMNELLSAEELADRVNEWAEHHQVIPANGQAGERMTVRNIRYYRTLGLLDAPLAGGGQGYGEKHLLQLFAVRLLQAQGLPLNRIQQLLFGRTLDELKRIETEGLAELKQSRPTAFTFNAGVDEFWAVMPLNQEFMLVSRRSRSLSPEVRERLLAVLETENEQHGNGRGTKRST